MNKMREILFRTNKNQVLVFKDWLINQSSVCTNCEIFTLKLDESKKVAGTTTGALLVLRKAILKPYLIMLNIINRLPLPYSNYPC